ALTAHAEQALGCKLHETTADGAFTLEPVYCLGLCALAPSAAIDDEVHARLTPAALDRLIAAVLREDSAVQEAVSATRVYVPRDSAALAVGADAVARAIAHEARSRGIDIELARNGSRGLSWLEPLVEVETASGRIGFGPVGTEDVGALFERGFPAACDHPLALGTVDEIPYLKKQRRLTFARIGLTDPLSTADYAAYGGWTGLRRALGMAQAAIVQEVIDSGLRGRGGAAFPTGVKWQTVLKAEGKPKYVVCNADEGDSGSFADRLIMESDPFVLIEGMAIAGLAVGAEMGYVYVRSEYPYAVRALEAAIAAARAANYLGADLLGSGKRFEVEVRMGAGSYVCGEETAMLESLEGRRGIVRAKPPLPAVSGLFGRPTAINNVVTLASVPVILAKGAAFYRGTLAVQLAGNVKRGGLVEVPFGATLRELLYDFGGGTASGRPIRAVQVGGPLGTYVPREHWDVPLDYEAYAALGHVVGHGSVVVHDDTVNMAKMARFAMEFCALESCGKCTPCRVGSVRGVEILDRIRAGQDRPGQIALLRDLCDTMVNGSLCAMGGMTPYPVLSALKYYPEDFGLEESDASH
ncbi:MAG: NADH-ubiquinone oxidoreductase-F iron-sulfur binding region domain-containing protein, partial [Burkholderiaceae bacterium]